MCGSTVPELVDVEPSQVTWGASTESEPEPGSFPANGLPLIIPPKPIPIAEVWTLVWVTLATVTAPVDALLAAETPFSDAAATRTAWPTWVVEAAVVVVLLLPPPPPPQARGRARRAAAGRVRRRRKAGFMGKSFGG